MGWIPTRTKLIFGWTMVVWFAATVIAASYFSESLTIAQWAGWLFNLIIGCTALISAQLDKKP